MNVPHPDPAPPSPRRGILLAGGAGTRLDPMTRVVSKQLLPVFDKPMVHYSLSVLMMAGIRDILVICTPRDLQAFRQLLGSGERLGLRIEYRVQEEPGGIAQAFLIGADFLDGRPSALILGDNLYYGHGLQDALVRASARTEGATVFAYQVADPERYGVLRLDDAGQVVDILEKPTRPPTSFAVTGLYFFDGRAAELSSELSPSDRGELEITDLNLRYLDAGALHVEYLGRGVAWMDTGTPEALLHASTFIHSIQERQGLKIACLEEIAWRQRFIDTAQLLDLADRNPSPSAGRYLREQARSEQQCAH